jgi:hypothetical protein
MVDAAPTIAPAAPNNQSIDVSPVPFPSRQVRSSTNYREAAATMMVTSEVTLDKLCVKFIPSMSFCCGRFGHIVGSRLGPYAPIFVDAS